MVFMGINKYMGFVKKSSTHLELLPVFLGQKYSFDPLEGDTFHFLNDLECPKINLHTIQDY